MTRFLAHALPALFTVAILSAISARAGDATTEALPLIKSAEDVPAGTPLREPEPVITPQPIVLASNSSYTASENQLRDTPESRIVDLLGRTVFGQVAYGEFEFSPIAPIGLENGSRRLPALSVDDDAEAVQSGGGFFLDTTQYIPPIFIGGDGGMNKRTFLTGGFNYFDTDIRQTWSEFNPFGENLLLPGTGDSFANFPAGVSLSSGVPIGNPNGFNVVFDPYFRHQFDSWTAYMKWGQLCPGPWYYVGGFAGLAYTDANMRLRFNGSVPGFNTDFSYLTNASIETLTPQIGLVGIVPIAGGRMNLVGTGHIGADFTDVHGDDYFRLSGSLSDSQHVQIEDDTAGFNYGATLGVQFPMAPFTLIIGGAYQHNENYPTIVRTGNSGDQTQVHFNDQSFWVAGIQLGLDLRY